MLDSREDDQGEEWKRGAGGSAHDLRNASLPDWFNESRFGESDVAARLHAALKITSFPVGSITNAAQSVAEELSLANAYFTETELLEFLARPSGLSAEARYCVAEAIGVDPSSLIEFDREYYRPPLQKVVTQALHYPARIRPVEYGIGALAAMTTYCGIINLNSSLVDGSFFKTAGAAVLALGFGLVTVSITGRWVNYLCGSRGELPLPTRPPF
jgi:hypothetical protein